MAAETQTVSVFVNKIGQDLSFLKTSVTTHLLLTPLLPGGVSLLPVTTSYYP